MTCPGHGSVVHGTRAFVVVAAIVSFIVSGCGDDGGSGTQAQVSPDVTTFVGGSLDDVPVPGVAEPLGPLRELDDGLLVRSYGVRDNTPRQVMDFYEDLFADRPLVEPVEDAPGAASVLRGSWRLEDGVLHVTAQRAPTVDGQDGEDGLVTQLSLELAPD